MIHAADRLYSDISYIAYHFHWAMDDILDLEHMTRDRFIAEIRRLNDIASGQ